MFEFCSYDLFLRKIIFLGGGGQFWDLDLPSIVAFWNVWGMAKILFRHQNKRAPDSNLADSDSIEQEKESKRKSRVWTIYENLKLH